MKEGKGEDKEERREEGEGGPWRGGERRGIGGEKGRWEQRRDSKYNIKQISSAPLGNISMGHGTHKHTHKLTHLYRVVHPSSW